MARKEKNVRRSAAKPDRPSFWLPVVFIALAVLAGFAASTLKKTTPSEPASQPSQNPGPAVVLSSNSVTAQVPLQSIPVPASVSNPPPAELDSVDGEAIDIDKASEHQNRGTALLTRGQVGEAVAEYRAAIKLNPEDEDGHYNLALALSRQGDIAGAIREYQEALRIYPEYTEAHNNLGNLLVKENRTIEAMNHFREALKIAPDNALANNNLGNALGREGNLAEAVKYFSEAVRLKPDYLEAHFNLGNAYLAQDHVPEAIDAFQQVLRLRPDFEPARQGLVKAQQKLIPGMSSSPASATKDKGPGTQD